MPQKLLVFIPCYNCAPQIVRVLQQFQDGSTAASFDELLVLDNGSSDGTVAAAVEAAKVLATTISVTVARNRANYNLGGSHKAAFQYARQNGFSHVVVLHGDDQGNIRDVLPVLREGAHLSADACLGARFMRDSKLIGYSTFRIVGNHVFNGLFSWRMRTPVRDLGSGLNVFGRAVLEDARIQNYADDLTFNIYLLLGLKERRLKLMYFPISWRETDQVSNVKMGSQALKTLKLVWAARQGASFWNHDHRTARHTAYEFTVVHSHRRGQLSQPA